MLRSFPCFSGMSHDDTLLIRKRPLFRRGVQLPSLFPLEIRSLAHHFNESLVHYNIVRLVHRALIARRQLFRGPGRRKKSLLFPRFFAAVGTPIRVLRHRLRLLRCQSCPTSCMHVLRVQCRVQHLHSCLYLKASFVSDRWYDDEIWIPVCK